MFWELARRRITAAFDRWASNYRDDVVPKLQQRGYSYEVLASLIVAKIKPTDDSILLEVGTGPGVLTEKIRALTGGRILGVDISTNMVRIAQDTVKGIELCQCNAEHLPFSDGSIDALFSTFVLHSIMDQEGALWEMKRVLKSNGKAVIVDLCIPRGRIPYWSIIKGNLHSFRYEHGALSKYRSVAEYEDMIRNCGLECLDVQQLGAKKEYTHFLFELQEMRQCSSWVLTAPGRLENPKMWGAVRPPPTRYRHLSSVFVSTTYRGRTTKDAVS